MGKRKQTKPTKTFSQQAQDSQKEDQIALFKNKFPFLKERAEECIIELKSLKHPGKIPNIQYGNSASFYSQTFAASNNQARVPGKEYFESQMWSFQGTAAIDQYYRMEDAIQTTLMENEYTNVITIQVYGNYILDTLALFSQLPFLKGLSIGTLNYYEPAGLMELMEKDCEFKTNFQTALKLSAKAFFLRKSLKSFTVSTIGSISSESIALGIIEAIAESANSLHLGTFIATTFFSYLSKPTACQLLESLASIQSLKTIDIGAFNLSAESTNETILALNKVLAQVKSVKISIGDLKPNEQLSSLRFGKYYTSLHITYSCDELRNPETYEELFRRLSEIEIIDIFQLTNSFNLDYLEPTRATKTYKTIKDIREILIGSALVEKQHNEEENISGKDSTTTAPLIFPSVQSFKFFELLLSVKQTKLTFTGLMSRRIADSLMNLFRNGKVTQVDLIQQQPYVCNPLNVPLQLRRVYENEAASIDFGNLYEIFKTKEKKTFTANYIKGSISIVNGETINIQLSTLQEKQNSIPVLFDPLAFALLGLKKLIISLNNITELSKFEQIFEQASKCPGLRFLQVNLSFNEILRKLASHNMLHDEKSLHAQSGELPVVRKYLKNLESLKALQNVILNIDVDQTIINSITDLLHQNKSIKTFILKRQLFSQYTLDFSGVVNALAKSPSITHALLELKLEQAQIQFETHRAIYNKHIMDTFSQPLAKLLENPNCKLNTIEIQTVSQFEGLDLILKSLLKQKNKTVLNLNNNIAYHIDRTSGSPYEKAVQQNLLRMVYGYYNDAEKFITVF